MTKLGWGVLGCGEIAAAMAKGIQASDSGRLVAVASRDGSRAEQFAAMHGIDAAYGNYEAMLEDPNVEVVHVALPHTLHAEWSIKAIEAGKHVLCEKPIALNHPEAMAMIDAAQRHDVFLMEGFMYRLHPQMRCVTDLIREHRVGRTRLIEATFSFGSGVREPRRLFEHDLGGGAILDVGCYCTSVSAVIAAIEFGARTIEPTKVAGVAHIDLDDRVDHFAVASLAFPGDVYGSLSCGVALTQADRLRICGEEGEIYVPHPCWLSELSVHRDGGQTEIIITRWGDESEPIDVVADRPLFAYEVDHVAAALSGRESPVVSWDESLANMRTLDRWREAVGLTYDRERAEANRVTVANRPLRRHTGPKEIPQRLFKALNRPVSRLIMGVTSATSAARAAVMWDTFFERGGNAFDTAWEYEDGLAERRLGWWVSTRGTRSDVVIVDKGAHTPDCYPEALTRQHHESLDRLQTDYVDLYLMHRDNPDVPVGEFVEVLNEHFRAGTMRAFGVSNWTLERITAARNYAHEHELVDLAAISNQFSLARMEVPVWEGSVTAFDPEWREWFEREQFPLLAWSSQGRGYFVNARPGFTPADWGDRLPGEVEAFWDSEYNAARRERARVLADCRATTPITVALAYVLCQPFPTFPIVGPRTLAELSDSIRAFDLVLDRNQLAWLVDGRELNAA